MFNTLDSYGTPGADGFICEGELPVSEDSSYKRHTYGGEHNDKEATQDANGIISVSQN